jgi:uroporphyrinogen III methyltransferase/synthase
MKDGFPAGKVWILGAGPGDSGLLTVKAAALLEAADVVVHDRLVSEDILLSIPPQTRLIDVGKASGKHPVPQEEIHRILIAEAWQGGKVVRLKGGDPFLFGRGGEEALALEDAGIPWEMVPGLSSALAVPALAGIPLTHRGLSSSLQVITWRNKDAASPEPELLQTLAKIRGTLVILMGGASLAEIGAELIKAGFAPALPAAIIEDGAGPRQKVRRFTLEKLAAYTDSGSPIGPRPPTLVVVGEVCSLGEKLSAGQVSRPAEDLPLWGLRIVVTRPEPRNAELCDMIRSQGGTAIPFPCIKTIPAGEAGGELPAKLPTEDLLNAGGYSWLLFTSATGVAFFFRCFIDSGGDLRSVGNCRMGAVGPSTAAALKDQGFTPDLVPPVFNGPGLGEALAGKIAGGEDVLVLGPRDKSPGLAEELRRANIPFRELILYDTFPAEGGPAARRIIGEGRFDLVFFASPSAVKAFAGAFPQALSGGLTALCIGESTAATARELGMVAHVAAEASAEGLCRLAGEL